MSWLDDWVERGPGDDRDLEKFEKKRQVRREKGEALAQRMTGAVQRPYLCPVCGGTIHSEPCEWCIESSVVHD